MNDELGNRIKSQYEDRTRYFVPRRTYTILRLDGKAFHTYTRGLNKPFDAGLSEDIDNAIIAMLSEIQGAVFAYTQSDEISILLTDFATPQTSAWFDGNIQKMSSVAASIMTAEFNKFRFRRYTSKNHSPLWDMDNISLAHFDCRCFTIPDRTEVMNYFRWRQQDCIRNSISMVAQSLYSHKELMGKSSSEQQEMIHNKGKSWVNDFSAGEKSGRVIVKEEYKAMVVKYPMNAEVKRTRWASNGAWVFTKDEGKLLDMIPEYE